MGQRYSGLVDFDHGQIAAVGILLTNVGSPAAPTTGALRRYLAQFLSDPRVIENQGLRWTLLLHGLILRTRPRRSAAAYRAIWTAEGSPLLAIGRKQVAGIGARLRGRLGSPIHLALGMGYGSPSVRTALEELRRRGCRRILALPLYPQYAAATVGSTFDAVADVLRSWRWVPELRLITHYHDEPAYIHALAASVRELWQREGEPDRLLLSFHGLPKRSLEAGDPYHCQCQKTARLLAEQLGLAPNRWSLAFQSRFGREAWLEPYTEETLEAWGREGIGVDVLCPGFSADCLETLEEIGRENREHFLAAGGGRYRYIAALNDRDDHLDFLADLLERNLSGWVIPASQWDGDRAARRADDTRHRAEAQKAEGTNA